jgi:hypothetical protein
MSDSYVDEQTVDHSWLRTFSANVDSEELVWHRDLKNRDIVVESGTGWEFQRENEIPFSIKKGDTFSINKMTYHRLIKGNTDLCIRIKENDIILSCT